LCREERGHSVALYPPGHLAAEAWLSLLCDRDALGACLLPEPLDRGAGREYPETQDLFIVGFDRRRTEEPLCRDLLVEELADLIVHVYNITYFHRPFGRESRDTVSHCERVPKHGAFWIGMPPPDDDGDAQVLAALRDLRCRETTHAVAMEAGADVLVEGVQAQVVLGHLELPIAKGCSAKPFGTVLPAGMSRGGQIARQDPVHELPGAK